MTTTEKEDYGFDSYTFPSVAAVATKASSPPFTYTAAFMAMRGGL